MLPSHQSLLHDPLSRFYHYLKNRYYFITLYIHYFLTQIKANSTAPCRYDITVLRILSLIWTHRFPSIQIIFYYFPFIAVQQFLPLLIELLKGIQGNHRKDTAKCISEKGFHFSVQYIFWDTPDGNGQRTPSPQSPTVTKVANKITTTTSLNLTRVWINFSVSKNVNAYADSLTIPIFLLGVCKTP